MHMVHVNFLILDFLNYSWRIIELMYRVYFHKKECLNKLKWLTKLNEGIVKLFSTKYTVLNLQIQTLKADVSIY